MNAVLPTVDGNPRSPTFGPVQTQVLLELTIDSLKHTLQQIEKTQKVVATSQALLKWSTVNGVGLSSRLRMPTR